MNKDIRIMLIADQKLVRYGLRSMLEQEEDMEVMGDFASAEEAFPNIIRLRPDIVLIDAKMLGMNGIEATRYLKGTELNYGGDVIVLAECMDYQAEALEAGAATYLLKDLTRTEFARAVRDVYWSKQSPEDRKVSVEETVELVVPPPANAAQLLRFTCQTEEMLKDTYASILQMIGTWDLSTVITVSLGYSSLSDFLDKLTHMPDVEKVEEVPIAKHTFPDDRKKLRAVFKPKISPSKRIRVTLK